MTLLRVSLLLILIGLSGLGAILTARAITAEVEAVLRERSAAALKALGMGWAEPSVDGFRVSLRGEAPDRDEQAEALATVALVLPEAAVLIDRTTVRPPPQPVLPPPRIEIARNALAVTFTGRLPGEPERQALLDAFAKAAPSLTVHPLIELRARAGMEPLMLGIAAKAVAGVPQAHVIAEPGLLRISGLAATEEERDRIMAAIASDAPDGARIDIDLRVPPPIISPFVIALVKMPGGGLRLETCAARSLEEAERLQALLARAGLYEAPSPCPVGLGGPPGDWTGALDLGLAALALVPQGRLHLTHGLLRLTVGGSIDMQTRDEAEALFLRLPNGFQGQIVAYPSTPTAPQATDTEPQSPDFAERPWLTASFDRDGVILAGRMPSQPTADALSALASARFPGEVLSDAVTHVDAPDTDPTWQTASFAAIEALALLPEGRLELTDARLRLSGRIDDPALAGQIHRALAGALPGITVSTALTVDLPAQVAAQPLSTARCLTRLNGHVALHPIRFAPGSAVLEAEAEPVLDEIAQLLGRCPVAVVEIGGHTDSQGSEGLNERLSTARANAVRDALLLRGIQLARLAARGYGEIRPIASNKTEAGRERNRRIAFAPAPEETR